MRTTDVILMILAPIALVVGPVAILTAVPPPEIATCPDGYDLRTGVRRDGHYECWRHPVGDPEWDGTWRRSPDRSTQPGPILDGRIHCTGSSMPIVVDYRTVGCQAGGWP